MHLSNILLLKLYSELPQGSTFATFLWLILVTIWQPPQKFWVKFLEAWVLSQLGNTYTAMWLAV